MEHLTDLMANAACVEQGIMDSTPTTYSQHDKSPKPSAIRQAHKAVTKKPLHYMTFTMIFLIAVFEMVSMLLHHFESSNIKHLPINETNNK